MYLCTDYRNYNILIHIFMADSSNYSIDIISINAVNGEGNGESVMT